MGSRGWLPQLQVPAGMSPFKAKPAVVGTQLLAAAAWVAFLALLLASRTPGTATSPSAWWCMPGMAPSRPSSLSPLAMAAVGTPMWGLMAVATTLPAALPALQHVANNSFQRRERRAVLEFLAVYISLWMAFGLLAMTSLALLVPPGQPGVLAACLAIGAFWEMTPAKRSALNRCHRSSPLAPRGLQASVSVARFSWINGSGCVASCWLMMLVMLIARTAQLEWAVGLAGLAAYEKASRTPRRARRCVAAVLAAGASGVILGILVS